MTTATVSLIDIGGDVTSEPIELGAAVNRARAEHIRYPSLFVLVGFGDCPREGCDYGFVDDGRMCNECRERTEDALIAG